MKRLLFCILSLQVQLTIAGDFIPNLGPDLPGITIHSGDVSLLLRQKTQWTPGRFDYQGHPMTTERSAYGTVFLFPEIGFIGTGHLENEPEEILSFSISVNGVEQNPLREVIEGENVQVTRVSKIRSFTLTNVITLSGNRITERATVEAAEEVPLKLVYHFMHAWSPSVSDYLAGLADGTTESGQLRDDVDRKFHIEAPTDWIAVFEPESQQFGVSYLSHQPDGVLTTSKLWNVPGTYRKYYLQAFYNESVPAGFNGTWEMTTAFGSSGKEDWQMKATQLAESLLDTSTD